MPLSVPPEAMDRGLFGELSVQTVSLLGPCVLQYPNLATQLTGIQISFAGFIITQFVILTDRIPQDLCADDVASTSEYLYGPFAGKLVCSQEFVDKHTKKPLNSEQQH